MRVMVARNRITVGILFAFVSAIAVPHPHVGPARSDSLYESPERTFYERFHGDVWESAKVAPKKPLGFQKRDGLYLEKLGHELHDCSDVRYRCVYGFFRVFAIPRQTLSPTEVYVVAGSVLRVEQCLRGDSSVCQVALISSDCQERVRPDTCSQTTEGKAKNRMRGPVLYFIYNEDFGVTAYGSSPNRVQTRDGQRVVATQMVLQGNRGLLAK